MATPPKLAPVQQARTGQTSQPEPKLGYFYAKGDMGTTPPMPHKRLKTAKIRPIRFARFLPMNEPMGSFGKGAESLVEVLSLCEQTLAALDRRNDPAESQPQPDKFRVQAYRPHAKFGQRFRLIIGGLHQRRRASGTR